MTNGEMLDFDALWDYDHPDQTEAKFRDVLAKADSHATDYRLQLLTQIARTEGLQRKFEDAHRTLDAVEAELNEDEAAYPVARIRYLLERGRVFNSSRQREQAVPLFEAALDHAVAAEEDFYAVDAAHMLGIAAPAEDQLNWNLKALEMAESSPSKRAQGWAGSLYNNIGWTYHDMGQYENALAVFEKGAAWQHMHGHDAKYKIARWCIARCLRSLNRIPEAVVILQELEFGGSGGYTYEELAECLLALGQVEAAQPYFALAYRDLSQDAYLVAEEPARLKRLAEMGKVQ